MWRWNHRVVDMLRLLTRCVRSCEPSRRRVRLTLIDWSLMALMFSLGVSCEPPEPSRRSAVRRCVISTRFQPDHFPSELEVEVEGSYAPLTLLDASIGKAGLWGADLWVAPGWQSYTLRLDGRILTDQAQPLTLSRSTPCTRAARSHAQVQL